MLLLFGLNGSNGSIFPFVSLRVVSSVLEKYRKLRIHWLRCVPIVDRFMLVGHRIYSLFGFSSLPGVKSDV